MDLSANLAPLLVQAGKAALFYLCVVLLFRLAGKRMAGQTTTFDLVVLISLCVGIQQATLADGAANAAVFVLTAFTLHVGLARVCSRFLCVRNFVRGRPSLIIKEGKIIEDALKEEGLTKDELLAGLRKLGIQEVKEVRAAHLEETGQISAIHA